MVETILDAEHQIDASPTGGGMLRERRRSDLRQVKRYSYRIIYRILPTSIHVLTVVHEKRDVGLKF